MSDTVIYFEGGGKREGRAQLRRALERFLNAGGDEPAGRAKPTRPLRVVACGSRGEALKRFRRAVEQHGNTASLLLIDSEGPMDWTRETPTAFLARQDAWNLSFAGEETVHLMVQFMESWIVSDPEALAAFYGKGFRRNALPAARDLETVAKADIEKALAAATKSSPKRRYHKMRDAPALLERVDPRLAQRRCRGCARLFRALPPPAPPQRAPGRGSGRRGRRQDRC